MILRIHEFKFLMSSLIAIVLAVGSSSCATADFAGGQASESKSGGLDGVKTIVFTGDSITDAGRDKDISEGMFLGNGFVSMVNNELISRFGDDSPVILNSGVSGNTVLQLYNRFRHDIDPYSPDWLVILIGINDAYNEWSDLGLDCDPENFRKHLARIFHDYAFAYKKVFLLTPFYIEEHETSARRTEYLDKYISVLTDIASENSNVKIIDVQAVFDMKLRETGGNSFQKLSPDRVHLTEEGNIILKDAVLEAFGLDYPE